MGAVPAAEPDWRRPRAAGALSAGSGPAPGAGAVELLQDDLPQANGPGGDLDGLVLADELEGLFQGEVAWRDEPHELLRRRLTDVRELLLLGGIDVDVVGTSVLADDHALVDLDARPDEQLPALLEVQQRVLGGQAEPVGHERSGRT